MKKKVIIALSILCAMISIQILCGQNKLKVEKTESKKPPCCVVLEQQIH